MTTAKKRVLKNRLLILIQERERKINRRVKLKDIAEFAEISNHTVTNWLRNKTTIYDGKTIERLCDYFNCDIGDLLYFDYEEVEVDHINE